MGGLQIKDKTAKDNLKILLAVILILAAGASVFWGISTLLIGAIYKPGLASIIILIVFLLVIWNMKERASWKRCGMLIVCLTAFVGCFFDTQGNPIYNLPIEWVYSGIGQLNILNESEQIGSEYVIDYAFQIVDNEGTVVKTISQLAVVAFRFFEYVAIYSLLVTVLAPMVSRIRKHGPEKVITEERKWDNWEELQEQELSKRNQIVIDSRRLDSDTEKTVRILLSKGNKIEAIKIIRQHTALSLQEAKELVEKMYISSRLD